MGAPGAQQPAACGSHEPARLCRHRLAAAAEPTMRATPVAGNRHLSCEGAGLRATCSKYSQSSAMQLRLCSWVASAAWAFIRLQPVSRALVLTDCGSSTAACSERRQSSVAHAASSGALSTASCPRAVSACCRTTVQSRSCISVSAALSATSRRDPAPATDAQPAVRSSVVMVVMQCMKLSLLSSAPMWQRHRSSEPPHMRCLT